jgi:nitroreductase
MELVTAIEKRRSVRKFLDKKVEEHIIKEIIRLGTWGPTACNRQGWRFIVVTDKPLMFQIAQKIGNPIISRAPVGIFVLYNKFTINLDYADNIESAAACIENMLLATTRFDLGACWINHLPPKSYLYKLFKIPKRYDIVAYIALGYPSQYPKALRRKYSDVGELISYNEFKMEKEIETRKQNKIVLFLLFKLKDLYFASPNIVKKFFSKVFNTIQRSKRFKVDHS